MPETLPTQAPPALLSAAEIAAAVQAQADRIAPRITDGTVAVALLTGALWFAADLTRALEARGRRLKFDALWMTSYGDQRVSGGRCVLRADLQRPVSGQAVLLIDDVFDSGLSLTEAARHVREAGAAEVLTAVFARKPWPQPRPPEPDFVAWEAPARFIVGYGMDDAGHWRGLPYVGAMD